MKKRTLIAAVVTPVVCASTGVMIARATNADAVDADGYCAQPSVYVDMAEGVSMLTAGPGADANCGGDSCMIAGAEQVEISADGNVQCVDVSEGEALSVTRRSDGSLEIAQR